MAGFGTACVLVCAISMDSTLERAAFVERSRVSVANKACRAYV